MLLQDVIAAEERYYSTYHRYTNDAGPDGLGVAVQSSPGAFYVLARLEVSSRGQSVRATVDPRASQRGDACGSLMLDSAGHHEASGSSVDCW